MPPPLGKLYRLLTKGVAATGLLWSDVQVGYGWVHRAAHILANADQLSSQEVQRQYEWLLEEMRHSFALTAPLQQMTANFLKVTASYQPGLFHCYDVANLPRTNNDLEHVFGSTRYHERRATGRKQASPGLVYVVQCVLLRQLLPRTPTLVALIWLRATWRSGERSENKLTIIMKPDATTLAFGKTLNATYKHWRNSYPREKCDLGFLGRPCHCFSVGSLSLSMSCPVKCNHQCFENLLHSCSLEMQLPCISFI